MGLLLEIFSSKRSKTPLTPTTDVRFHSPSRDILEVDENVRCNISLAEDFQIFSISWTGIDLKKRKSCVQIRSTSDRSKFWTRFWKSKVTLDIQKNDPTANQDSNNIL